MESKYLITLIISFAVVLTTVLAYIVYRLVSKKHQKKRKEIIRFFVFFAVGIFISATILFIPLYYLDEFGEDATSVTKFVKTFLLSIHNATRLFILDGDFVIVQDAIKLLNSDGATRIANLYGIWTAIIYVIAPILTFTFIFAIIANFWSRLKFYFIIRFSKKRVFIFSELNRKSILLAESIHKSEKYKNSKIFFTNVDENDDNLDGDLIDRAREIKATLFKKEITSLTFGKKVILPLSKKEDETINEGPFDPIKHIPEKESRRISLFFMNLNDVSNVREYYDVFKEERRRGDMCLYLFSTSPASELALNHVEENDDTYVLRRRVTIDNFFIYRYLYENGTEIFDSAHKTIKIGKEERKIISVVIVGLGRYGRQFLQALAWYGQMTGYYLKINAFDGDSQAENKIAGLCPELMDEKHNKKVVEGDAQYDITIHSGQITNTKSFNELINQIDDASICFTCLGKDEDNINAAIELRVLFERVGIHPIINAIVQELDDEISIKAINHAGQGYDIKFIGDDASSYSVESVIDSELEEAGKRAHVMWSQSADDVRKDVEKFYRYEYFYLSSCASAIHTKAKKYCNVCGINKPKEEQTKEDKIAIQILEHNRWNAWMRSQGFIYSGSREKSTRNDLAKKHHDLVNFEELSAKDRKKDSDVVS